MRGRREETKGRQEDPSVTDDDSEKKGKVVEGKEDSRREVVMI